MSLLRMAGPQVQPEIYQHYTAHFTVVRDARERARAIERETLNAGESLSRTVDNWEPVRKGANAIAALGVADVSVMAWNIEALARLEGFDGLAKGFDLAVEHLQQHWPQVFSPDMASEAALLAPFSGLNGISSEGSLIQPIRLMPLLPGYGFGTMNLWMLQSAERNPSSAAAAQVNQAKSDVQPEALRTLLNAVVRSCAAYARLSGLMDSLCGADAPGSSFTTQILDECQDAAKRLGVEILGEEPQEQALPAAALDLPVPDERIEPRFNGELGLKTAPAPKETHDILTREEAFAQLLRIAHFFRRTEPHSPLSYSIETMVRRGRMTLPDLLAELMPEGEARTRFLTTAGIHFDPSDPKPT
jgi:type VI secretion system protein ImpA